MFGENFLQKKQSDSKKCRIFKKIILAIIWLIIKRLRILSDLERDLNKRLVIVKSGQCLSVQDAIILEKDLNSLLNLFEESYKIKLLFREATLPRGRTRTRVRKAT